MHGPARRDVARRERDESQYKCDAGKHPRIAGAYTEENTRHEPRQHQCREPAHNDAKDRQASALTQNEPQNILRLRA